MRNNFNRLFKSLFIFALIPIFLTNCKKDGDPKETETISKEEGISLSLSWRPPAERVNGKRLMPHEIGGYEVLYRKASDPNWKSIVIYDDKNWVLDSYEISGLASGTYEVMISCFDIDGMFSEFSDPVTITK